jgi:oligosaccharide repeat unit polymerase
MIVIITFMYLALSVALYLLMRMYVKGNIANLFREPVSLALLGLLVVHGLLPLVQYPSHLYRYEPGGYSLFAHSYSIVLALIFAVVMVGAYSMSGSTREQSELPVLLPMSGMGTLYLLFCVTLPGMIAAAIFYRSIMAFGFEAWAADRILFSDIKGAGLSSLICHWLYIAFIASCAGYFSSPGRSKGMLLLFLSLGAMVIAFFGFIQSRNAIACSFLTALGVYFVTSPRSRITLRSVIFSRVAIVICILFVVMIVVQQMRPQPKETKYDSLPTTVLKVVNGAFGNHENVLWMADHEFDLTYGATYIAGLVNLYPRAFWPDKPFGAGPYMKNLVDPGSYYAGGRGMSSLTTGMVTESYMNGGLVGVVLCAVVTGVVLRGLTIFRSKCYGPWAVAIYCYSALLLGFSMTYGEFLGIYTRWITDTMPLAIGYVLCEAGLHRQPLKWRLSVSDQMNAAKSHIPSFIFQIKDDPCRS